jgi:AcrR family transcriptional regulator
VPKVVDVEARRAQLTQAVAAQIARTGMDGVTLREVARRAGWTTGAVAHYFADKRELLLATYRSRADLIRADVAASVAAGLSPLDALIEHSLPLDDERRTNWQVFLAFMGAAIGDPELTAAHEARSRSFHASVGDALQDEVAAGRIPAGLDLAHEARRLVALLNGVAVQAVFDPLSWGETEQRLAVAEHLASLTRSPA